MSGYTIRDALIQYTDIDPRPTAILGSTRDYTTDKNDPHLPPGLKAKIAARDLLEEKRKAEQERFEAEREAKYKVIKGSIDELVEGFLRQPEQLQEGATLDKIVVGIVPGLVHRHNVYVVSDRLEESSYYLNLWITEAIDNLLNSHKIGVITENLNGCYQRFYFARPQK
jgi:hypothetical protein